MVDRSNKSKRNRLKRNMFLSLLCYFTIIWCEYLMVLNMMAPFSLYQVNPSPSSAAYMRHWTGSSLVQVMACLLFGAKPLPEPMLAYCWLDSWEHNWMKFESEFYHFHSRRCNLKMSFAKMAGVGGLGVGVGVWVGVGVGGMGWVKC